MGWNKYGHVVFENGGLIGAWQQKDILERLRWEEVIYFSDEDMVKWFNEDKDNPVGAVHHYVLHNKKEVKAFKKIVKDVCSPEREVYWCITWFNWHRGYDYWLRRTKRRTSHGERKKV